MLKRRGPAEPADSRTRAGNTQGKPEAPCGAKSKEVLTKMKTKTLRDLGGGSKGAGRAPRDQSGDNLNNEVALDYKPQCKINTHESILI